MTIPTLREHKISTSIDSATYRRSQFIHAIPPALSAKEDNAQDQLASENSSSRSKLRKIYNLMTEIVQVAEPYVACQKGCSSCCKMNVTLSEVEAKYIEAEKGIKAERLSGSRRHDQNQFIGIPCPFLKEDVCSIYDVRPFACRKHLSFDTSPYWCEPERSQEVEIIVMEWTPTS